MCTLRVSNNVYLRLCLLIIHKIVLVIFETNDYTDFYVHSDFIGAVFGVGGVNIGAVGKKFRVSIEVTPVHLRKFDHVLCTIRGASRLTHRNALNDIETNIKEEFTCRQSNFKQFYH